MNSVPSEPIPDQHNEVTASAAHSLDCLRLSHLKTSLSHLLFPSKYTSGVATHTFTMPAQHNQHAVQGEQSSSFTDTVFSSCMAVTRALCLPLQGLFNKQNSADESTSAKDTANPDSSETISPSKEIVGSAKQFSASAIHNFSFALREKYLADHLNFEREKRNERDEIASNSPLRDRNKLLLNLMTGEVPDYGIVLPISAAAIREAAANGKLTPTELERLQLDTFSESVEEMTATRALKKTA